MENPVISIIVPVYKVEQYLERCVDSILNQTYTNLEIILVNDGSPDKCGEICERYKELDLRIKVIHKENGGLSDARNVAIDVVTGDFIMFIDSDDFVSKYYVEHLWLALSKDDSDMSISWFENVFDESTIKTHPLEGLDNYRVLSSKECLRKLLYQDGVETMACGKLYKKNVFDRIRYPKGKLYEDVSVTPYIIEKCRKVAIISNVDYYYWQRGDSIQYSSFRPSKMDGVIHMCELKDYISVHYPELAKASICRYFSTVCNIFFQIHDKADFPKEFDYMWNEIKKFRRVILFDMHGRKKARLAALLSYLGYLFMKRTYSYTQFRGKSE